ncbi:DsbA family oxidoreductase [Parasporobacterium paucivorans]|uniref:Predicted dithiol-disulfide isomerase, DsbA family n=1 Tax=Parasporobacterium paucivorans DSM 15970 TaxID=1122934 RepID=A0A1M6CZX8_9FIRM|nr:DsbA family protein [Parasporobacterium paucivorans]SHI66557.1 Predicted dithiol-disulfide isomerase, DsbA family [Parasporobacterium paucivorans DSM 15970]
MERRDEMKSNKKIDIIEFTDPVCTWCWGSEPFLRKLETWYGDQLEVKYVMGGLVKDIRDFYDSYNDIGRDPERSNKQIVKHWVEASERHGMPVESEGFHLFSNEYPSTYPQNIAYKAAQMENQVLADKFLRRMREASSAEAKQTSRPEVQIELASEVGLDISKFLERLSDGSAEAAFQEDLKITQKYGVRGFPTFLVRYGDKEILLHSYQSFESFQAVINSLTAGSVTGSRPEKTEENVLGFISKYERVAPIELQMCFDMTTREYTEMIDKLLKKNQCRTIRAGNGVFIEAVTSPLSCDTISGVCSL